MNNQQKTRRYIQAFRAICGRYLTNTLELCRFLNMMVAWGYSLAAWDNYPQEAACEPSRWTS